MTNHSKIRITPITTRAMLVIALAIPLVLVIVVGTVPHQVANAQLTPAQQQALQSLSTTGFTNHQPLSVGAQNFTIPYSIKEGQVIAIVPAPPTTSIDVIIAPTQFAKSTGVFTMQIPRHLLDSKNPDGTDKPFRLTLDGHGLAWKQLSATNTDRTIGIYFGGSNGFLQIYGTQIA
ncbi:MAG TPA: hypothetical protein VI278_13775 [Nitrososphaeraceae archaeon]